MFKRACYSIAAALLLAAAPAVADTRAPLSELLPSGSDNGTAILDWPGQSSIGLVGLITEQSVAAIRARLNRDAKTKFLVIDSMGGDVRAAIDLAHLIHSRKMSIVVAGRCFSSCSHYLFPAAITKSVLPGSLVGLHFLEISAGGDKVENQPRLVSELVKTTWGPEVKARLAEIADLEGRLYKRLGINSTLDAEFRAYRALLQTGANNASHECPKIDMVVLRKAGMGQLGATSSDSIWEPSSNNDFLEAAKRLHLDPRVLLYGDIKSLTKNCLNSIKSK